MDLKYCTRCGANFHQAGQRLFVCNSCGLHFYIAPSACNAIILINSKGEFGLGKRRAEPYKDYWDLVGGFIDFDETLEESLVREVKEEIGFDLKEFKYFASYTDTYFYKDIDYHTLGMIFVGEVPDQGLKPSDDISEFKFFTKDEIPWDKLAFNNVKKALEDYLNQG